MQTLENNAVVDHPHLQGEKPSHFCFRRPHSLQLLRIPKMGGIELPPSRATPDLWVCCSGPAAEVDMAEFPNFSRWQQR